MRRGEASGTDDGVGAVQEGQGQVDHEPGQTEADGRAEQEQQDNVAEPEQGMLAALLRAARPAPALERGADDVR